MQQHVANAQSFDFIVDRLQSAAGTSGGSPTAEIKRNASDSPGPILWLKRHQQGLSHVRIQRHRQVWLGREAMKPARHMALAGRSLRAGLLAPRARHTARRTFYEDAVASGVNARYLENLYLQWKVNPAKLDTQWNDYFRALEAGQGGRCHAAPPVQRLERIPQPWKRLDDHGQDHLHHVRSKSNKSNKSHSIDGESQRTTELQPLEPFERHLTDRSSNSVTTYNHAGNNSHLEDDEKVEMPRSSKPVAPGIIFQGKADLGLMSSECLMIRELLQSQHEDMMIRFDQQQDAQHCATEMLNKIYRTRGSSMSSVPRERRSSIASSTSVQPAQSKRRSSVRQSPQKLPDGGAKMQSKKLFSSLTRVDEELRQKAADVDAEQAKAHRKYTEESEDGRDWAADQDCLHFFEAFVANPWFDLFFAIAILTNAIFIGFEVQASIPKFDENSPGEPGVSTMDDELAVMLSILGKAYAGLFFVELCIRVLAQRRSFVSMRNPEWRWNLMDTIIVLASLVEIIFEVSSYASGGEEMSLTGMSGLRTLRIIRITRLVKIARLARILRFVMALRTVGLCQMLPVPEKSRKSRTLTQSILHTLKSLIWAVVLLLLIVYTFAILFTQVVNDYMRLA
eukprot:s2528_g30.t1